jgi:hypothetical protein
LDVDATVEEYLREKGFLREETDILHIAKLTGALSEDLKDRFKFIREQMKAAFVSWKVIYEKEVARGSSSSLAMRLANKIFDATYMTAEESADSIYPTAKIRQMKSMDPAWKAP